MIEAIYFMTDRSALFFDARGNQIEELQELIGWTPDHCPDAMTKIKGMIRRVCRDKPDIYLVRVGKWKHQITAAEFFALLGLAREYMMLDGGKR